MYKQWIINKSSILLGLFLLISCSEHQLTDKQYIEKAKEHQAQHQIRAAIIELKNALQVNPKNSTARELLGQIYVDVGDGESGEKELSRAIDLGAENDNVKTYLARALLQQGKYQTVINQNKDASNSELLIAVADAYISLGDSKSAATYINKAKSVQPDALSVKLAMAKLAVLQNDYEKANGLLQDALTLDPENKQAWRYSGILAMQQTRFSEAEHAFQKVIDLEQEDLVSSLAIQAWLGLIQSQLAQKKLKEAGENVKTLKKKSPSHPGVEYLAALLAFEKGDFETARDQLLKLNNKLPDYLPGILLLGASQYALKNYEQAAVYLSRYVNEVPSHLHARKLLAATRIKQRRSDEALNLLQEAEDSAPEDAQLIAMIAQASVASGDVVKGTEYLRKAKSANPDDPSIRAELARVLMGQGAFDQAIKELETIADQYSKPRDVLLVSAHLRKKDYAAARKLAKQLTLDNPGPDTETLLGGVELISGARIAARNYFEKALKLNKEYVPAMLNLGKMDLEDGNFTQASKYFDSILLKQPTNLQAIFGLAQIADRQGNKQDALAYVEKAREADENAVLPRLILGRYYLKIGKLDKAMNVVEEFQTSQLNEPAVILLAGKVYQRSGNPKKSLELFQSLVNKLPNAPGAYFELASAQASLNQVKEAKKSLKHALDINPDFTQAKYALAQIEFRTGNASEALTLAKQLQQQKNAEAMGYSLAGDIYMQQKAYSKARAQYMKAKDVDDSSVLTLKLASSYSKEGQHDKAISVLNDWIARNPEDYNVQMVAAEEHQKMGKTEQAIKMMDDVLSKQPENAVVLNNLAWMYFSQNDARALEYAERAHKLRPEAAAITDTLGWILVQTDQQLPRAVELLREAVVKTPNIPEIKYHLSVGLYKTDNKQEAKRLLNEIVASNAEFSEIDKAKELLEKLN